jgi:hypothetical protein
MLPDWSLEDFSLKWDMKERAFEVSANPMLRPMLKNLLGGAELGACEALIDEGSDGWSLIIKATWSLTPFGQMVGTLKVSCGCVLVTVTRCYQGQLSKLGCLALVVEPH